MTDWREQSDELHERVQSFIVNAAAPHESFERLALDIAAYQARRIPAFARLIRARGSRLDALESIPAVPVEAFRMARVAAHPEELDCVRFLTSGTTSLERGQHVMRRSDTYRLAAVTWGRPALVPNAEQGVTVVCLAPRAETPQSSSLGFMMQAFLEELDPEPESDLGSRWFLAESGVELDGLRVAIERAREKPRPLLVLATSFALVYLLDALAGCRLPTDESTVVMQTGGFKGKSRSVPPGVLRRDIASAFGIDESRVVGEYGMTELSSQLYEETLGKAGKLEYFGWYAPPPWLRVEAVDPVTLMPVPAGEVGVARFTDLANVDSALRIVTADRILCAGKQIQLLGRSADAPLRGCSLADEELVGSRG